MSASDARPRSHDHRVIGAKRVALNQPERQGSGAAGNDDSRGLAPSLDAEARSVEPEQRHRRQGDQDCGADRHQPAAHRDARHPEGANDDPRCYHGGDVEGEKPGPEPGARPGGSTLPAEPPTRRRCPPARSLRDQYRPGPSEADRIPASAWPARPTHPMSPCSNPMSPRRLPRGRKVDSSLSFHPSLPGRQIHGQVVGLSYRTRAPRVRVPLDVRKCSVACSVACSFGGRVQ